MSKERKFTDEQKYEIALDLVAGKLAHAEICRKWQISSTYAYKLRDRALALLREGMTRPVGQPDAKVAVLAKRVGELEQLAGDQALAIHLLKKTKL
jgi:transposase-like protein